MTRQIKRTRQIEDFVIEKLARRGLISEKEKENTAQFVKGNGIFKKLLNDCSTLNPQDRFAGWRKYQSADYTENAFE